jgi:hypothetical protein
MTDTTTTTPAALKTIPEAANQASAVAGAPIPSADIAHTVGGAAQGAVSEIAPAAAQLATTAADVAPVAHDLSSALIVDGTLWALEAFSVLTWALILIKGIQHLRIAIHNRRYSKQFWSAADFRRQLLIWKAVKGPQRGWRMLGFQLYWKRIVVPRRMILSTPGIARNYWIGVYANKCKKNAGRWKAVWRSWQQSAVFRPLSAYSVRCGELWAR